jgi:hypothetical protein
MGMFRKNKEVNVKNVSLDRKASTPRLFSTNLENIHCKKRLAIFPSPAVPARESLISDIPAGDRKSLTFFLQCICGLFFSTLENLVIVTSLSLIIII